MMPFLTEIAFLIVHWTIHSFGVTLLFTTKLALFISRMALLLLLFLSLLSFSFFATWLPPEILAFSFLCCVYFFFSWSIVGFHGRRLLTDQSGQCRELYRVWGISLAEASFLYPFRESLWLIYRGLIHHQVIQTHRTMHIFVDEWRSCQRTLLNFVHKNWKYTARKQHRVSVSSGFPTQSCMLARCSSLWQKCWGEEMFEDSLFPITERKDANLIFESRLSKPVAIS